MKTINCLDCGTKIIQTNKRGAKKKFCETCKSLRRLETRRKTSNKWRLNHPEEAKKRAKNNYEQSKKNPTIVANTKKRNKNYLRKLRKDAMHAYGGKCECCGETQYEFLAFDHINGGGAKHRNLLKKNGGFLRWLKNNNYPKTIRILCHNCNMAMGFYGYCPHQSQELF